MPKEFTLGELVIMEMALCQMLKDIDINMAAGQQIQKAVQKIEMKISELEGAHKDQERTDLDAPTDLKPRA